MRTVLRVGEPGLYQSADIRGLLQQIRMRHPAGVDTAFVGLASTNAFKTVRTPHGIIAILIGLLLPAMQKLTVPNSSELAVLQTALKPAGTLGFVMADGSVREARSGKPVVDCEGYASLTDALLT